MATYRTLDGKFASAPSDPDDKRVVLDRRNLIRSYISDADVQTIINCQIDRAKRGDLRAAKLILSYALGRPQETRHIDEDRQVTITVVHRTDGAPDETHLIDVTPALVDGATDEVGYETQERE